MFIIIRKSQILLLATTVFFVIMSIGMYNSANPDTIAEPNKNIIVIDAGHGGLDGGAVGVSGVLEKDINLKVALYLKEIATKNGKTVIMTRDSDVSLDTSESAKVRNQKRSDLENRRQILQQNQSGVFVSIHMNKFQQESVKGAQVFFTNNDQSRILAQNIQQSLKDTLSDGNKRVAKPAPSGLYIFKGCQSTAVVVECGFLSNKQEEALLNTPEYQKKLAQAIYDGICK